MTRSTFVLPTAAPADRDPRSAVPDDELIALNAEAVLADLAGVFLSRRSHKEVASPGETLAGGTGGEAGVDARYRALVEQMPAVVFMADLDEGIGEAYVSPQIESALGFSQQEWGSHA